MAHHRKLTTRYAGTDQWGNRLYVNSRGDVFLDPQYIEWDDDEPGDYSYEVDTPEDKMNNSEGITETTPILSSGKPPDAPVMPPQMRPDNAKNPMVLPAQMKKLRNELPVKDAIDNGGPVVLVQHIAPHCGAGQTVKVKKISEGDPKMPQKTFHQHIDLGDDGTLAGITNTFPLSGNSPGQKQPRDSTPQPPPQRPGPLPFNEPRPGKNPVTGNSAVKSNLVTDTSLLFNT